jgi:lipid II:glycine glycyltransferase (peptidoglycan interpeptide bridge formation enzyme)
LPTKTLQIDLSQTQEQIFAKFKKDARLALRKNSQFTIHNLQTNKEIETFRKAWKTTVGWRRYVPPLSHLVALKKAFKKNCLLYYCTSTVIQSGAIFLKAGNTAFGKALSSAYYWQAFTNKEGRKKQTQYQIVWQGILWAKKQGCKIFDFEGIFDPRFPNKSWVGFTHFKKSFGGYEVEYPGCYTKFYLAR